LLFIERSGGEQWWRQGGPAGPWPPLTSRNFMYTPYFFAKSPLKSWILVLRPSLTVCKSAKIFTGPPHINFLPPPLEGRETERALILVLQICERMFSLQFSLNFSKPKSYFLDLTGFSAKLLIVGLRFGQVAMGRWISSVRWMGRGK
jgi:hypothetical protein